MNLRKVFGRKHKYLISCILVLVAVQYILLTHWVLWKYPVWAYPDVAETSLMNTYFPPNQLSIRDKREMFKIGDVLQIKPANDYNIQASKDNEEYDFDTSVRDIYPDKEEDEMAPESTLLILFTSWGHSSEKQNVHQTLLRLWASWTTSLVHPLVFTNDSTVRDMATSAKWHVLPEGEKNDICKGPPVLRALFTDTIHNYDAFFYGYANSDIIFGNGLIKTLRFLRKKYQSSKSPVLIIGRRYNYDFINNQVYLNNPIEVGRLLNYGTLVNHSTDYYITNKVFPWEGVPMVSVGRLFVARAVVTHAIKHRYDVIDATKTIESVHLTTADGNYASQNKPGRYCNYYILRENKVKPSLQRFGHCECAKLETVYTEGGQIELKSRNPSAEFCRGLK